MAYSSINPPDQEMWTRLQQDGAVSSDSEYHDMGRLEPSHPLYDVVRHLRYKRMPEYNAALEKLLEESEEEENETAEEPVHDNTSVLASLLEKLTEIAGARRHR